MSLSRLQLLSADKPKREDFSSNEAYLEALADFELFLSEVQEQEEIEGFDDDFERGGNVPWQN